MEVVDHEKVFHTYTVKPDFSKWGPRFGNRMNVVRQAFDALSAGEAAVSFEKGEDLSFNVEGETITLSPEELVFEQVDADDLAVVSDFGCTVAIDTRVTRDLLLEGLMRDFVRHVQNLRKTADFNVSDRITLYYEATGDLAEAIEIHADYIKKETLSDILRGSPVPTDVYNEELKLGTHNVKIGVLK